MTPATAALLPLLLSAPPAAEQGPSVVHRCSLHVTMSGDTLVETLTVSGRQGDDLALGRLAWGFDPAYGSAELLEARFGPAGGTLSPVPEWAVDTLSGAGGLPLSLVVAFPALRPGMEIELTVRTGRLTPQGEGFAGLLHDPSVAGVIPDTCAVLAELPGARDLRWEGDRFEVLEDRRDGLLLYAERPDGPLWLSAVAGWGELREVLLSGLREPEWQASPFPPDLREAALQASAAGAGRWTQLGRLRTILCNSMLPEASRPGHPPLSLRTPQQLLDGRRGTPLELAALFAAICSELGIEAEVLPATALRPMLPVPEGWTRFLVRAGEGGRWLLEPSAYLTPAFYVHRPDTLWALSEDGLLTLEPNRPVENMVEESWSYDPETGRFRLTLDCRGEYDMELRRRMAGLSGLPAAVALSEWTWRSGRTAPPDSVATSDLYDLAEPATLQASGRLTVPMPSCVALPLLSWPVGEGEGERRLTWTVAGPVAASDTSLTATEAGGVTLVEPAGAPPATVLLMPGPLE